MIFFATLMGLIILSLTLLPIQIIISALVGMVLVEFIATLWSLIGRQTDRFGSTLPTAEVSSLPLSAKPQERPFGIVGMWSASFLPEQTRLCSTRSSGREETLHSYEDA
jgi:hypothetical protein